MLKILGGSVFCGGVKRHIVVENNRARSRPVQIGWRNRDEVQIINSFDTGMQVVRFPANHLHHKQLQNIPYKNEPG